MKFSTIKAPTKTFQKLFCKSKKNTLVGHYDTAKVHDMITVTPLFISSITSKFNLEGNTRLTIMQ